MHIRLTSGCVHRNLGTSPLYVFRIWADREGLSHLMTTKPHLEG